MNNFLPPTYEVPENETTSGYLKTKQGENRIRILASPILGWVWWIDKNGNIREKGVQPQKGDKPVRVPFKGVVPVEAAETVKHFWAMKAYNYAEKAVQVWEVTQKQIQNPLKELSKDEDWGSPLAYDIVITKTGEKLETEYSVIPKPKKELAPEIAEALKNTPINLESLYDGGNPFAQKETNTEGLDSLMEDK